jgi:hypothetical protein
MTAAATALFRRIPIEIINLVDRVDRGSSQVVPDSRDIACSAQLSLHYLTETQAVRLSVDGPGHRLRH